MYMYSEYNSNDQLKYDLTLFFIRIRLLHLCYVQPQQLRPAMHPNLIRHHLLQHQMRLS